MTHPGLARWTAALYADRSEDLPCWRALARQYPDPVLDLGCGDGRVAQALADDGHIVIGIDHDSQAIALAEARRPVSQRRAAHYVHADITDFRVPELAGLSILSCHTFAQLSDLEAKSTLACVRRATAKGGAVTLDLPAPNAALGSSASGEPLAVLVDPLNGHPIQVYARTRRRGPRRSAVTWWYDELLPDGHVLRVEVSTTYTFWTPSQLRRLLAQAGFPRARFFSNYDMDEYRTGASHLIALGEAA
jgi:ubiquinone/menaquinone biosynthesis C-methylase UbiE